MYAESAIIYILIDPLDNEIRYVGKTWQTPSRRLSDHCRTDRPGNSHKENWIAKVLRWGYRPLIEIVQSVPVDDWPIAEQYWIGYYRELGCNLTNGTLGGDGGNTLTPAARAKLSKSKTGVKRPPFSDEWRARMSASRQGQVRSPEQRSNMSAAKLGKKRKPFSVEWRFKLGAVGRNKTHCLRGHEFTPDNTYISKAGKRSCRTCGREHARIYRIRKQQAD